jgi:hypothetical protein
MVSAAIAFAFAYSALAEHWKQFPTSPRLRRGARKQILNAAVKARWRFDPKLQRWLCPKCASARDASKQPEDNGMTDDPSSVPQKSRVLGELFAASHLL